MENIKSDIEIKRIPNLYFFHPLTIVVMLVLDWGGFFIEVPQIISPITLLFTFIVIFFIAAIFTYYIQITFTIESKKQTIIKSIIVGFICAIPTGIMSTLIGSIVLALSGFNSISIEGIPGLINMF